MGKNKNIKKYIFAFCLGLIVAGGASAAAITLTTKDIKFKPTNPDWKATNLDQALNDLYKIGDYNVPVDTYFYDKTTVETEIKMYKKVDGKYYECDKFGKVTEGVKPSEVDVKNLVAYKETNSENLSVGNASYVNKNLILGDNNSLKDAKIEPNFLEIINLEDSNSEPWEKTALNKTITIEEDCTIISYFQLWGGPWYWGSIFLNEKEVTYYSDKEMTVPETASHRKHYARFKAKKGDKLRIHITVGNKDGFACDVHCRAYFLTY